VSGISYGSVANLTEQDANVLTRENERMRKLQSAAKVAFIDRLLSDLDILIYCELSALYYME
jgi:predicted phosphohydrolase